MTTLEICLIVAVVYLVVVEIFNFIATKDSVVDEEDLLCNLFWIIFLPYAIIRWLYRKIKNKKR